MTHAICVNCGSFKFGAYTTCKDCNFCPQTELDRVYSIVLTDHYHSMEELNEISHAMRVEKRRPVMTKEQEDAFLAAFRGEAAPSPPQD